MEDNKQLIQDFLDADREKIAEIIKQYPLQIPTGIIGKLFGCNPAGVRDAILKSQQLGITWCLEGNKTSGYCVPTARFVRWYLNLTVF